MEGGDRRAQDIQAIEEALMHILRLALAAQEAGRLDIAEQHYRNWMKLSPNDPRPQWQLSIILLSRGEYTEEAWRLHEARRRMPEGYAGHSNIPDFARL